VLDLADMPGLSSTYRPGATCEYDELLHVPPLIRLSAPAKIGFTTENELLVLPIKR
jgi:hypothetical protein